MDIDIITYRYIDILIDAHHIIRAKINKHLCLYGPGLFYKILLCWSDQIIVHVLVE